jgi:type IV pilus assembly protein PilC
MLAAGWALPRSLETLARQTGDRRIAAVLPGIAAEIARGAAVGETFMKHRALFGPLFCGVMELYDAASLTFPGLLSQLADYYEKNEGFRDRVIRTVKYPALITIGSLGIIFAMLVYFVPPLLLKAAGSVGHLPPFSRLIFHIVGWIATHPEVEIGLLAALLIPATLAWYLNNILRPIGRLLVPLPLLSDLARKEWMRRFSLALASLLSGGVPLPRAISIAAETVRGSPLYGKLALIERSAPETVLQLAAALQIPSAISSLILNFLDDARKRQSDADLCRKVADFYQEEIETSLTAASLIVEPIVIMIAGLIGGTILLALSGTVIGIAGK